MKVDVITGNAGAYTFDTSENRILNKSVGTIGFVVTDLVSGTPEYYNNGSWTAITSTGTYTGSKFKSDNAECTVKMAGLMNLEFDGDNAVSIDPQTTPDTIKFKVIDTDYKFTLNDDGNAFDIDVTFIDLGSPFAQWKDSSDRWNNINSTGTISNVYEVDSNGDDVHIVICGQIFLGDLSEIS